MRRQYAEKRRKEVEAVQTAMNEEKKEREARAQKVAEMEKTIAESKSTEMQAKVKQDADDLEELRKKRDEMENRRYEVIKELLAVREKHRKMFKKK